MPHDTLIICYSLNFRKYPLKSEVYLMASNKYRRQSQFSRAVSNLHEGYINVFNKNTKPAPVLSLANSHHIVTSNIPF